MGTYVISLQAQPDPFHEKQNFCEKIIKKNNGLNFKILILKHDSWDVDFLLRNVRVDYERDFLNFTLYEF